MNIMIIYTKYSTHPVSQSNISSDVSEKEFGIRSEQRYKRRGTNESMLFVNVFPIRSFAIIREYS
jgi:hypothetical protein